MKKIYKIFTVALLCSFLAGNAFAQEEVAESQVSSEESTSSTKESKGLPLAAGLYVSYSPALGVLSDYVVCCVGGGLSVEYQITNLFGLVVRAEGNYNPVKVETLSSMWSAKASFGVFATIPLFVKGLYFVPEVDYGAMLNFPTLNPAYPENKLESMYVDQLLMAALGVRYSNEKIMGGRLAFDLAATYTFCTEEGNFANYVGGRAGVIFKF